MGHAFVWGSFGKYEPTVGLVALPPAGFRAQAQGSRAKPR